MNFWQRVIPVVCMSLALTTHAQVMMSEHPALEWVRRAVEEAGRIETREHRAEAWGTIAGAAALVGDRGLYHRLITMAMATAKETDGITVGATMWAIAESQARAGDVDAALAHASQAVLPVYVTLAYAAVGRALAERGEMEAARQAIERGMQARQQIEQAQDIHWADLHLAQAMLAAGDVEGARLRIQGCDDATRRAEALACLAQRLAQQGDREASTAAMSECRQTLSAALTEPAQPPVYADLALVHLAQALAVAGTLEDGLTALGQVADPAARAAGLIALAGLACDQGEAGQAHALLADARTLNQSVAGAYERAGNWLTLTQALVRADRIRPGDESIQVLIQGLETPVERAFASLGVAQGLLKLHPAR